MGARLAGSKMAATRSDGFSGTSSWSAHFQCRGGSSFILLRGLSLPNVSRQVGWQDLFPTYMQCIYLIFKWEGWGNISTTKSISGDIDNRENLINQV